MINNVLVVGAGPVGLTTALCLARYKVPVTLVEQNAELNDQSKALALSPVALTQLDHLIPNHEIGNNAKSVSCMEISYQNQRLNSVGLEKLAWPRNRMLVQTQMSTEKDLLNELDKVGVAVVRNTKVVQCDQVDDRIHVSFESNPGNLPNTYRYVVGCEGKKSIVRDVVGAELIHNSYDMFLVLCDHKLITDLDNSSAHYFIYDDTFIVVVPLYDDVWRVVVKLSGEVDKNQDYIDTLKRIVTDKTTSIEFHGDSLWKSVAPLYCAYVDKMQKGNAFIAGDAAHLYSPIGGTGMNTGICDAMNLAWKLAFSINGISLDDALLASYSSERAAVIKETAMVTDMSTKLISRQVTAGPQVEAFLPLMRNRQFIRNVLPMSATGLNLKYAIADGKNSHCGAMHWAIAEVSFAISRLDTEITKNVLILNVLNGKESNDPSEPPNNRQLTGVTTVSVYPAKSREQHKATDSTAPTTCDELTLAISVSVNQSCHDSLKKISDLIVVRPDGIIMAVGNHDEIDVLYGSLATCFKAIKT